MKTVVKFNGYLDYFNPFIPHQEFFASMFKYKRSKRIIIYKCHSIKTECYSFT